MIKNLYSCLLSLFLLLLLLMLTGTIYSNSYHIDQINGKDSNDGLSPKTPWASLEKVNGFTFKPGDSIFFKSGTTYFGRLKPKGSGKADAVIVIDKYGEGVKPCIQGEGKFNEALLLENVEYWEVNNLDISNKGVDVAPGRRGVLVKAENFGECHHIYLRNLSVHDVNGSLVKSKGGGSAIFWKNSGDSIPTRFVDLRIENCHLFRCERNGINSGGYTSRRNWYPSLQVVIKNNLLEEIPGDGIVPIGCDGAVVENNIMRNCPDILPFDEAAAGIWPWSCDNTLIQFNEVSGHNAKWDGQGFDSDWNCRNTVIQYNYSHDNAGGFLLICNSGSTLGTPGNIGTINTIVRYNVSINDGIRTYPTRGGKWFSPVFHISGPCEGSQIYNNLIIMPARTADSIDSDIIKMGNWGGPWPTKTLVANNIFYVLGKAGFDLGQSTGTNFEYNNYFGSIANLPADQHAVFSDPLLVNVSARGNGFDVLKNFMLTKKSPCLYAGSGISAGVADIFNQLPQKSKAPSIGISQKNFK